MSNKFKIGDKVIRVTDYLHGTSIVKGGTYIVSKVYIDGSIDLEGTAHSCYDADYFELVNEDKPPFKSMVLIVDNEAHAEVIQKALFELGYKWNGDNSQRIKFLDAFAYVTDSLGGISYASDQYSLRNHKQTPRCKVEVEQKYSIVEDIETITYDGKQYNKRDFEAAIATLSALV